MFETTYYRIKLKAQDTILLRGRKQLISGVTIQQTDDSDNNDEFIFIHVMKSQI